MCVAVVATVNECVYVCGYLVVLQNRRVKERCAWVVRALVLSRVVYCMIMEILIPIKEVLPNVAAPPLLMLPDVPCSTLRPPVRAHAHCPTVWTVCNY